MSTQQNSQEPILNLAGGPAFAMDPKTELLFLSLTSFLTDKFYESANQQLERLKQLIHIIDDKQFVAKVAIFARNEFGMRTVTHAIAVELILTVKNEQWLKYALVKMIRRPDDILEIVAYYLFLHKNSGYKKGLPASLRKAIAIAIAQFDEYQLAKYKGSRTSVKMVDILNLVHPKPTKDVEQTYQKLMNDNLKVTNTWESELSQAGQAENPELAQELKDKSWQKLIRERKIGYFALLRNLRNIIQQSPDSIDDAIALLTDEILIKKSLVLPFRYLTAIYELEKIESKDARKVIVGLNQAAEIALSNVPNFSGNTLIALDVSGSMQGKPISIGSLFAAILVKNNNADLILFSSDAQYHSVNIEDNVLTIAQLIKSKASYAGTNFHAIFSRLTTQYDRIIILSDMQGWMGDDVLAKTVDAYKNKFKVDPYIYSFDLNGYGSLQFHQKKILCIAGFSEKIFDFMLSLEENNQSLLNKIHNVQIY